MLPWRHKLVIEPTIVISLCRVCCKFCDFVAEKLITLSISVLLINVSGKFYLGLISVDIWHVRDEGFFYNIKIDISSSNLHFTFDKWRL